MAFREDITTLYDFLKTTSEGNLRNMMVGGDGMTEGHFRLLMRIVKGSSCDQMIHYIEMGDLPKIKLKAKEIALKDGFWEICLKTFNARGLIASTEVPKPAAAVPAAKDAA